MRADQKAICDLQKLCVLIHSCGLYLEIFFADLILTKNSRPGEIVTGKHMTPSQTLHITCLCIVIALDK